MGQCLDTIAAPEDDVDLDRFTPEKSVDVICYTLIRHLNLHMLLPPFQTCCYCQVQNSFLFFLSSSWDCHVHGTYVCSRFHNYV